ncbi:hypothetical protein KDK77_00570 [bacterium]|nr:hypothetical protein [bacterium]MCP5462276.1 hypothetical protein [bacterium]
MIDNDIQRDFGEQPIARIMADHNLKPHDIVAASTEQITHKMVAKAIKGRRLTPHIKIKILNALNAVSQKNYSLGDLFTY